MEGGRERNVKGPVPSSPLKSTTGMFRVPRPFVRESAPKKGTDAMQRGGEMNSNSLIDDAKIKSEI